MIKYIVRRILVTIPLLLGIVFLTFTLMNLVPGNPIAVLLDEKMNPEMVERLTRELHLNDPAHVKFFKYIQGLLRGDMGKSIIMNQSVSKLIWDVFPKLRNCLLPVITIMLLQVTALLGGAIITESVFAIPGIGTLSISALTNRDMPLLQGTIILSTALIIAGNLLADIICAFIDPRIRAA